MLCYILMRKVSLNRKRSGTQRRTFLRTLPFPCSTETMTRRAVIYFMIYILLLSPNKPLISLLTLFLSFSLLEKILSLSDLKITHIRFTDNLFSILEIIYLDCKFTYRYKYHSQDSVIFSSYHRHKVKYSFNSGGPLGLPLRTLILQDLTLSKPISTSFYLHVHRRRHNRPRLTLQQQRPRLRQLDLAAVSTRTPLTKVRRPSSSTKLLLRAKSRTVRSTTISYSRTTTTSNNKVLGD